MEIPENNQEKDGIAQALSEKAILGGGQSSDATDEKRANREIEVQILKNSLSKKTD